MSTLSHLSPKLSADPLKAAPPTPIRRFAISRLPLSGRPLVTIAPKAS
jgi:hypothetical protein